MMRQIFSRTFQRKVSAVVLVAFSCGTAMATPNTTPKSAGFEVVAEAIAAYNALRKEHELHGPKGFSKAAKNDFNKADQAYLQKNFATLKSLPQVRAVNGVTFEVSFEGQKFEVALKDIESLQFVVAGKDFTFKPELGLAANAELVRALITPKKSALRFQLIQEAQAIPVWGWIAIGIGAIATIYFIYQKYNKKKKAKAAAEKSISDAKKKADKAEKENNKQNKQIKSLNSQVDDLQNQVNSQAHSTTSTTTTTTTESTSGGDGGVSSDGNITVE